MKPKKLPPQPVRDLFAGPAPSSGPARGSSHPQAETRTRNDGRNWSPQRQRLAEIQDLIHARHGGPCDTDDGRAYFAPAAAALLDEEDSAIIRWARTWTPNLSGIDEVREIIAEARGRYGRRERFPSAQAIGDDLRLTVAERETLGIKTIRPAGMTDRQFKAHAKARRAEKAKARRAKKGATPRSMSKAAVARSLGISLASYKRHLKSGKLTYPPTIGEPVSSLVGEPVSSLLEPKVLPTSTDVAHEPRQTLQGPAMMLGNARRSLGADGPSPGAKSKNRRARRSVALPLPDGARPLQPSLWSDGPARVEADLATLQNYHRDPDSPITRAGVGDLLKRLDITHEALGGEIGLSRAQISNGIRPRNSDRWSASVVEKVQQAVLRRTVRL